MQLQELFKEDAVFDAEGYINRYRKAVVIFSDDKKREALNLIVHPAV